MQQPLLPDWSAGRASPAYHPFRGVTQEFGPRLESHICHFWLPLASRSPSHRAWLRCHWCQRQSANEEYKKSPFERRFHWLFPTISTHTAVTVLYHPVWQVSSWAFKARLYSWDTWTLDTPLGPSRDKIMSSRLTRHELHPLNHDLEKYRP